MARLVRTILLGTLAAGAGIWWLGRAYEIESSALAGFLLSSALLVGGTIVAAVAGAVVLGWLHRWHYRRDSSFNAFRGRIKTDPKDP